MLILAINFCWVLEQMTVGASSLAFLLFIWLFHPLLFHKNARNFLTLRSLLCHTRLKLAASQNLLGERWHGRIAFCVELGLKRPIAHVCSWNSQGVKSLRSCDVFHRHLSCKELFLFCTTANYSGL